MCTFAQSVGKKRYTQCTDVDTQHPDLQGKHRRQCQLLLHAVQDGDDSRQAVAHSDRWAQRFWCPATSVSAVLKSFKLPRSFDFGGIPSSEELAEPSMCRMRVCLASVANVVCEMFDSCRLLWPTLGIQVLLCIVMPIRSSVAFLRHDVGAFPFSQLNPGSG